MIAKRQVPAKGRPGQCPESPPLYFLGRCRRADIAPGQRHSFFSWAAFLVGFYSFLVGSKILLAVVAGHSRSFFQGRAYRWTLRFLGALLLVFAFCLFREGLMLLKR